MESNRESHLGNGQLPSDVIGVIVCTSLSLVPQEPNGFSELEEGVNTVQHCESGVHISREISVRPNIQKAEMGKN